MIQPTLVLFYVADIPASVAFYRAALQREPVQSHPGFALFAFDAGPALGLWSREEAEPAAEGGGGGGELALAVPEPVQVDGLLAHWRRCGARIAQQATAMDFGHTGVALDPDGHRLRVYCPSELATTSSRMLQRNPD